MLTMDQQCSEHFLCMIMLSFQQPYEMGAIILPIQQMEKTES